MSRSAALKVLVSLVPVLCVAVAAAQDAPSASAALPASAATAAPSAGGGDTPAVHPIIAAPGDPRPDPAAANRPHRARAISPDVAAQLAAAAPKFTPAAPKPPPKPEDEETDLRDVDKPRNGIIRLPKYVVHERPPPVLNERTVNTRKGLEDIAMKRYLTDADRALNRFTLPLFGTSAKDRAMAMYEEDERLKNMNDMDDAARMVGSTDQSAGQYVKKQAESTFVRPGNFDWHPIGR